ncbi:hypothetical protein BC962_3273 [Gillisia mitskevichiae]|uniref:Uncharacterized protein n=1 Tax=Gillisia mitskevichiae TaxID=270921 RepID=A0A495NXN8_9FLAO|nr:hypothetical protein BC962_3273 [Gillisia mitskevichiae]
MKKNEIQLPFFIKASLLLGFSILLFGQIAYYLGRFLNNCM